MLETQDFIDGFSPMLAWNEKLENKSEPIHPLTRITGQKQQYLRKPTKIRSQNEIQEVSKIEGRVKENLFSRTLKNSPWIELNQQRHNGYNQEHQIITQHEIAV